MNKKIIQTIKVSILAVVLSFGIGYALAWTPPTSLPPGGNVSAPLNTSATGQIKAGPLTLSGATGVLTATGVTFQGALSKITFQDGSTLSSAPPRVQTFRATPSVAQGGDTVTVSWDVKNVATTPATPCVASGYWSGNKESFGTQTFTLTGPVNYTFTLTCSGGSGATIEQSVSVNVLESFTQTFNLGNSGTVLIPAGVSFVRIKAQGEGNGGAIIVGGSASYAYYMIGAVKTPIVVVGGAGGVGRAPYAGYNRGSGGYTGGVIHGAYGLGVTNVAGGVNPYALYGNSTNGGNGGAAVYCGGGGAGGQNGTRADGGQGAFSGITCQYRGYGGGGLNSGAIGGGVYGMGGGGGGGLGGGGGGSNYLDSNGWFQSGGGGGGSGYLAPGWMGPDTNGFMKFNLSDIGNTSSIFLKGAPGDGYITIQW